MADRDPGVEHLQVESYDGTRLEVDVTGSGRDVVLLHGLTATHKYVLMGSRLLERDGCRIVSYDARGHGHSSPAPERDAYGYDSLASDTEAVISATGAQRPLLIGVSMGAHTAAALAASVEAAVQQQQQQPAESLPTGALPPL